jgi:hypothetical protein
MTAVGTSAFRPQAAKPDKGGRDLSPARGALFFSHPAPFRPHARDRRSRSLALFGERRSGSVLAPLDLLDQIDNSTP